MEPRNRDQMGESQRPEGIHRLLCQCAAVPDRKREGETRRSRLRGEARFDSFVERRAHRMQQREPPIALFDRHRPFGIHQPCLGADAPERSGSFEIDAAGISKGSDRRDSGPDLDPLPRPQDLIPATTANQGAQTKSEAPR